MVDAIQLSGIMQKAIDFENKGHDVYLEAANASQLGFIKKTFSYLAEQELRHRDNILSFLQKHNAGKLKGFKAKGDSTKQTKKFFSTTVQEFKENVSLSDNDAKAYEVALALERMSYDFYKQQHTAARDEASKAFFSFLMEQENIHYEMLEKSYGYLKDPSGFFANEEKAFYEGDSP